MEASYRYFSLIQEIVVNITHILVTAMFVYAAISVSFTSALVCQAQSVQGI
jgi:hypothetical protein